MTAVPELAIAGEGAAGGLAGNGENDEKPVPQKDDRQISRDETPYRKNHSTVPQKNEAVPQNFDNDIFAVEDEDGDDFQDYSGQAGWRIEQRFYTKKDGTVMLYWNYRSREPVYINDERRIGYKPGGKKIWQQPPSPKRKKNTK